MSTSIEAAGQFTESKNPLPAIKPKPIYVVSLNRKVWFEFNYRKEEIAQKLHLGLKRKLILVSSQMHQVVLKNIKIDIIENDINAEDINKKQSIMQNFQQTS